jgi:threonylcarbamoyladenosine tRNA methylthiotransferase MtaB
MVKKNNIVFLHVFPYSARENTVACKMKQLDVKIRKERAQKLREVADQIMHKYLEGKVGTTTNVVIEGGNIARADDYSKIIFDENLEKFSIQKMKILEVNNANLLRGELCSKN